MTTVKTFDSWDEVVEHLRKLRADAAGAETFAFQETIRPGDHYARWLDEARLMVFGEVLEPQDDEEQGYMRRHPWARLVRAYSTACPAGEYGDEHVANMVPLEPEEFALAKDSGWEDVNLVTRALTRALSAETASSGSN